MPKPAKALAKKAGPLPIWAWALLGGGLLVAVYFVLRRNTEQVGAGIQLVSGNVGNPQDAPSGGYPSAATPPSQMLNDEVLWEIAGGLATLSDAQRAAGSARADEHKTLGEQIAEVKDRVAQTITSVALQPPAVSTPTAVAAGSAPAVPANQPGPSRYYSYKPGKAPAGRKRDEAPKGARLGFTAGRGYYVIK